MEMRDDKISREGSVKQPAHTILLRFQHSPPSPTHTHQIRPSILPHLPAIQRSITTKLNSNMTVNSTLPLWNSSEICLRLCEEINADMKFACDVQCKADSSTPRPQTLRNVHISLGSVLITFVASLVIFVAVCCIMSRRRVSLMSPRGLEDGAENREDLGDEDYDTYAVDVIFVNSGSDNVDDYGNVEREYADVNPYEEL